MTAQSARRTPFDADATERPLVQNELDGAVHLARDLGTEPDAPRTSRGAVGGRPCERNLVEGRDTPSEGERATQRGRPEIRTRRRRATGAHEHELELQRLGRALRTYGDRAPAADIGEP